MSEPEKQCSLLDELDRRQNEVLSQLDDLNGRIESLLHDFLQSRHIDEAMLEA